MFRDFRKAQQYLQRTLKFFQQRLAFTLRNIRPFGGFGNVFLSPPSGRRLLLRIGEASGVQDALWGFGIRLAVRSGVLAAQHGKDSRGYRRAWERQIGRQLRASLMNRLCVDHVGDLGYRWLLWRLKQHQEPLRVLRDLYSLSAWKSVLSPAIQLLSPRASNNRSKTPINSGKDG
jgi:flavin-dependent dehydrogenase